MSDLICRKTMMRCNTPGMCAPYGGCRDELAIPADQVLVPRELLGDIGVLLDTLEVFGTKLPPNFAEMIDSAQKKITILLHP